MGEANGKSRTIGYTNRLCGLPVVKQCLMSGWYCLLPEGQRGNYYMTTTSPKIIYRFSQG